jgi:hypothetical protein
MMRRAFTLVAMFLAACNNAPTPSPMNGAWESHVAFTSGAFASMKDLRFLYAFNAGGTMTESSNYDGAPPVPPAYGVWKQTGPSKFQAKYIFYMTKPPSRFDELVGGQGWLPTGHGVITEDITLSADGNSWESKIHWDAFDMEGKPAMGGGDGTTTGKRISF